jgi:hypothetical protein
MSRVQRRGAHHADGTAPAAAVGRAAARRVCPAVRADERAEQPTHSRARALGANGPGRPQRASHDGAPKPFSSRSA